MQYSFSGTEDKRRSLYDGAGRWDIPSLMFDFFYNLQFLLRLLRFALWIIFSSTVIRQLCSFTSLD
ncbi:hypothetical protein GBA52_025032 [Prunus armeniaca]|nr:hypothetical protein GBA52_025032 [Prunus armeniaca]